MGLSIAEQAFIQAMMAAKAVSSDKAFEMYNTAVENAKGSGHKMRDSQELHGKVERINKELRFLELQFRTVYSPWEQETFWGLCNTIEDEAVRSATLFKDNVRTFFFSVEEELRDCDGEMSLTEAQNMGTECGLSVMAASQSIQKLQKGLWLKVMKREDQNAVLIFGARSLLELSKVRAWTLKRNFDAGAAAPVQTGGGMDVELEGEGDDMLGDSEEEIKVERRRRSLQRVESLDAEVEVVSDSDGPPVRPRRRKNARRSSRY